MDARSTPPWTRSETRRSSFRCALHPLHQPLGNLLRARPELGIELGADRSVTAAYFADDSVLFPRNRASLEAQLQLVKFYCVGSGAKLNRAKSQFLTLSRTRTPIEVQGLSTVTSSIDYLGIKIGPAVTTALIERLLEDKLTGVLHRWRFRARTVDGRRLLANTMVLSMLWHYTPHFDFQSATIARWQRMIANYILYGTQPDASRSLHLIPRELHPIPKTEGGVQIPQITQTIARQRFKMLQDLVRGGTSTREPWTVVAGTLFRLMLGPVCSIDGFEWLWTHPSEWPRKQVSALPPRRVSSWKVYAEITWPDAAPARDLGKQ